MKCFHFKIFNTPQPTIVMLLFSLKENGKVKNFCNFTIGQKIQRIKCKLKI